MDKNINLIVETDLGNDIDDFFSVCWLAAIGVNIRAITIVPGSPDQVAVAKFLVKHLGLDCAVGSSKLNIQIKEDHYSGVHRDILKKYKEPFAQQPDGSGEDIIKHVVAKYPDSEFFVIGPATNIRRYLATNPEIAKLTMQGGFMPYSLYKPTTTYPDFEGKEHCPTFNFNGDRKAVEAIVQANIPKRSFVGKNVCHTVVYDGTIHNRIKPNSHPGAELFKVGMDLYLEIHDGKKFHDPVAAACHVYPEIAVWYDGTPVKMKDGWTTQPDDVGSSVCCELDYDAFWDHILEFK